ncbi:SDR family oxidoreductase [Cryptosporangium phraense]|uniref:SDR family oxidoreductase n=1 Tax=Cryptosporangium phraense TaxID=2593070 RepID=A0A545AXA6_9ACTN|nr:SDR family oxidoreductase [Cryptosporangium phraense]TQS45959.1 SDR family oxidoreductase [Cryptosporangium phraense]
MANLDFTGATVLVTGGTKGVGKVIAETFTRAGADVVVCARNEPATPPPGHFVRTDVRDPDACRALVDATVDRFGRLDVLINNAGGSPDADAATVSPRFVEKIVALNLLAPFYLAQAANAAMTTGSIVNIGSVSASDPQPGTAAYAAAKAGLLTLTKALALEWGPSVRVNHITAGLIRTEADLYTQQTTSLIPAGRLADPEDIANACLYLSSDLANYVNGADLAVHGGGEIPARFLLNP